MLTHSVPIGDDYQSRKNENQAESEHILKTLIRTGDPFTSQSSNIGPSKIFRFQALTAMHQATNKPTIRLRIRISSKPTTRPTKTANATTTLQ
jgi:hypothetical protein